MKKIDEDFPELDADQMSKNKNVNLLSGSNEAQTSKKDMADISMFSNASRAEKFQQQPLEEQKEAKKPVFTSSKNKKTFLGGDQADSIQNSKQNYDFSGLKMASASSKVVNKEARPDRDDDDDDTKKPDQPQQEKPRQERRAEPVAFEDDGDFVTVQATTKRRR